MKALAILVFPILTDCLTIEEKHYTANKGSTVDVKCDYDPGYKEYVKYWCKGYYRASCTILLHTSQKSDGDISIYDQATDGKMTVTMEKLRSEDTDWYWCGIERSHLLDIMDYTHLTVTEHATEKNMNNDELPLLYYILTPLLGFALLLFVVAVLSIRTKRKNNALGKISCQPRIEGTSPHIVITPPSDNSESYVTYADIILNSKEQPQHLKQMDISGKGQDRMQDAEYSQVVFLQ